VRHTCVMDWVCCAMYHEYHDQQLCLLSALQKYSNPLNLVPNMLSCFSEQSDDSSNRKQLFLSQVHHSVGFDKELLSMIRYVTKL
jgi:hypothetical protein